VLSADNQQERVPENIVNLNYYLAGFVDGEGSFTVSIRNSGVKRRFGWTIDPFFQVYQHKDNSRILFIFKEVLGCGYVSKKGGNPSCFVYCVDRISELISIIIPFFDKYPLVGEKYQNFLLFKEIVIRLSKKEHFDKQGFVEIVKLCFRMNRNGYYRKNSLETVLSSLEKSSETIRQTP
jgi:hypothetical protein